MSKGLKNFIRFLIMIVILSGVYFGGYAVGHKNLEFEKGYIPKILNTNLGQPQDVDFSLFWNAWDILKSKFIGQLNTQEMVYDAISGMVQASDDPYTLFLKPEEAKRFSEDLNGAFEGIGAELANKNGLVIVIAPLDDSPAQKAGLRAQDVILKIDGADITGLTFYEVIDKVRGPKATSVILTVFRPSTRKNEEITIVRDTIVVESVKWEEKDNNLYIKISQFGDDTLKLMQEAAQLAIDKNYPGLVLDLRSNPGGYLESAIDIASLFLEKDQVVVKEENKEGEQKTFRTTLNPILKNKKLVIIVDEGSASASEILAGAIQDHQRGEIVGEKTFGKGSVQSLEDLKEGSKLKVTIAKWLTPNDRVIEKEGISPDMEVKMSEDDIKNKHDPQLDKALEIVKK